MTYGYTTGVFDLYHPDHVELLRRARTRCTHLTVGVTIDTVAAAYKEPPVMSYEERAAVIASVRWVDSVVPQTSLDKVEAWRKLKYDVLFVGDDWYMTPDWQRYEQELDGEGVPVIYLPTTRSVSSTQIRRRLAK
jgi:glycerol-3-phosphate cytidylyltransferase